MLRREFLMLAKTYDPKKHGIGGWFMSEKIDGQRAFWDGGISRGMPKVQIPWANNEKDGRLLKLQISTGLWTRLGNVIHAPDWFLDQLPAILLDGELWHGVRGDGELQNLRRIVSRHEAGDAWRQIKYHVFDMPSPISVFQDGRINNPNFKKIFKDLDEWQYGGRLAYEPSGLQQFQSTVRQMEKRLTGDVAIPHPQVQLPFQTSKALEMIDQELNSVCNLKGEGLMLRKPESYWYPKRMDTILKVKKLHDAEGIVTGYITGRETDKGSKLLGMLGALILNYEGKRLELSGFTDRERKLCLTASHSDEHHYTEAEQWATEHPGQEVPAWISAVEFPRGSSVTFRYRGKSLDGIPTSAAYWRKDVRL